jgi:hypothetical protein
MLLPSVTAGRTQLIGDKAIVEIDNFLFDSLFLWERLTRRGARLGTPTFRTTVARSKGYQLRSSGRVKPKVRLCEPWVMVCLDSDEPRSGDRELMTRCPFTTSNRYRPYGARYLWMLTQGSQSLALGSTPTAATQLVEGSPLVSSLLL